MRRGAAEANRSWRGWTRRHARGPSGFILDAILNGELSAPYQSFKGNLRNSSAAGSPEESGSQLISTWRGVKGLSEQEWTFHRAHIWIQMTGPGGCEPTGLAKSQRTITLEGRSKPQKQGLKGTFDVCGGGRAVCRGHFPGRLSLCQIGLARPKLKASRGGDSAGPRPSCLSTAP